MALASGTVGNFAADSRIPGEFIIAARNNFPPEFHDLYSIGSHDAGRYKATFDIRSSGIARVVSCFGFGGELDRVRFFRDPDINPKSHRSCL